MSRQPADSQRRSALCAAAALALAAWGQSSAWAQSAGYPQRPVKLIVPNAPGSSVDTIGRLFANQLATALGQAVVIDNKPGAAGALGVEAGKLAAPDGYTLIAASSSSVTVAPLLQKAVSYLPLADFSFIAMLALLPNVLVCNPGLPVTSVAEFVTYAKAQGGRLNMASAGPGSVSHLAGLAFATAAGFESLHVPYKGGSQSVASVASGETHWTLTPAPAAMGLVQGGRLKALGHSMGRGMHPLGPVPAIAETAPGFEFTSWIGLIGPRGLPPALVEQIRRAAAQVLQQSALAESFALHGAMTGNMGGDVFRAYVAADIDTHRKVIRLSGVQAE